MSKPVDIEALRRPLKLSGLSLIALSFQTLGIIYSDIGTSPLYVLNGIWSPSGPVPSPEDVIGGVSAIIWSLILLPLLKYVFVALRFGTDEGEGGCFALYHGIFPPVVGSAEDDRTLSGESFLGEQPKHQSGNKLQRFKWVLLPWALFGTSLTLADGVFTPAVSVTSAVAGIAVAVPSVSDKIIPISIAFLAIVFAVQRFGTEKLSFIFSPVTLAWLTLIAVTGAVNTTQYPGIFRAFDPSRAVLRNYELLSGILLALTGCEALFANLGQFNMLSIQLSFGCVTFPALVLAYLGQGARLISDGEDVISNVFYRTIPGKANGPLFWIMYVFAILATLVASQAMITATFSLIQQVINMKSFPPLHMSHTSEIVQGQIYVPTANWALAIATLVVVGAFKSPAALSDAYGFSVATVMFVTTTLIAIQCYYVKHLPWFAGVLLFLFFGFFDGLFWGAASKKVPQGAWVPLMIGCFLLSIMVFWNWAKGLEDEFDGANRKNLRCFILTSDFPTEKKQPTDEVYANIENMEIETEEDTTGGLEMIENPQTLYLATEDSKASQPLAIIPTLAIFHKYATGRGVPHSFTGFLRQYPALPRVVIFLSVRTMTIARMPAEERYIVDKVRSLDGFYGVTYQIGFRDKFNVDVNAIVNDICRLEKQAKGGNPKQSDVSIREIRDAAKQATHIIPHYHILSRRMEGSTLIFGAVSKWTRELFIGGLYRRLVTMFPETANWSISADEIIHVGITARI